MTEDLLKQGIAAAKAGRKEEALGLLMQVTEIDEQNERAWLWLSQVVDSIEDRVVCLENVLAINPYNDNARAGLAWLAKQGVPVASPEPVSAPRPPASSTAEPCPRCGQPVPLAHNECEHCGLPMVVLCPRCRSHVEVQHSACPSCQLPIGDYRAGASYHLALAQAYIQNGKSDLALPAIGHGYREAAGDPEVLVRAAELYAELGHPDSALPALEGAAAAATADAGLQARMGMLYQRLNRPDQARAAFESSVRQGSDPAALLELARLEISEGHAAEARELLKQVTKARPLHAEAYLLLGDAEQALGHEGEARNLYQHAGQLAPRESAVGREVLSRTIELGGRREAAARADWRREQREIQGGGRSYEPERPGCVTVYAVLLALSALLGLCSLAFVTTLPEPLVDPALAAEAGLDLSAFQSIRSQFMPFLIGVSLVYAVVQGALAAGLWFMKNWARIVLIGLSSLGLIGQLISLGSTMLTLNQAGVQGSLMSVLAIACVPLFAIGLQVYIIFWFATNGRRFA